MRAIQIRQFGGPDVLELVDAPEPSPAEGEVLIDVTRSGVNFADTHARQNRYLAAQELPLIPGTEVAGVRRDTGQRVIALCGSGGYAEQAVAPKRLTFPVPDDIADDVAVALLVQGTTAYHLCATTVPLRHRDSVLVIAGAGGTGSLLIAVAKLLGAGRVIATASSEEKRALCRELGADEAIDGAPEGLAERITAANGGEPIDVVFEPVGGEVFEQVVQALAPFGRIAAYGISSSQPNELRTSRLLRASHTIAGFWIEHCLHRPGMVQDALEHLFTWVREGRLHPLIGATYPLERAAQAHRDLASRRTTGKLLLDPAHILTGR